MPESAQHTKGRVRPPRVHITYDVDDRGAMKKIELPFVVGVLADLSGNPKDPLAKLVERDFVNLTPERFNTVMEGAAPRVVIQVDNKLAGDGSKLGLELNFPSLDAFGPLGVAKQVEPLNELLNIRNRLTKLLAQADVNAKFGDLLNEIARDTEAALAKAKGSGAEGKEAAQ
jgi:type VI secretion system protein ImpB